MFFTTHHFNAIILKLNQRTKSKITPEEVHIMPNDFFTYKGRPLVRNGNTIYYGNMTDDFVVMMMIKDTVKKDDLELANNVTVQLMSTDPTTDPKDLIPKKSSKVGLYNALEIADIWLTRSLDKK